MSLRAAFMGSPDFAVPSLNAVYRACDLQLVICQPDKPAGRGRRLKPPAVKEAAQSLGVDVLQPHKLKDGSVAATLRDLDLDVVVVTAFGRILPLEVLQVPRHGCINVHASILPRWRGAAPIQRAVLAGDRETGVSIMQMAVGLDTGPVYEIATTPIGPEETSGQLFERLADLGGRTLERFLLAFPDVPPPVPQDEARATHAPPLRKEEGVVDWARPAARVVDHVRGMDPWPAATTWRGEIALKLFGARAVARSHLPGNDSPLPGTVVDVDGTGMYVACLDGPVCIREVQPAGGRRMPAKAYAAGKPFVAGERLRAARDDRSK
jgi:methionyl-tRNA formyltransferase